MRRSRQSHILLSACLKHLDHAYILCRLRIKTWPPWKQCLYVQWIQCWWRSTWTWRISLLHRMPFSRMSIGVKSIWNCGSAAESERIELKVRLICHQAVDFSLEVMWMPVVVESDRCWYNCCCCCSRRLVSATACVRIIHFNDSVKKATIIQISMLNHGFSLTPTTANVN